MKISLSKFSKISYKFSKISHNDLEQICPYSLIVCMVKSLNFFGLRMEGFLPLLRYQEVRKWGGGGGRGGGRGGGLRHDHDCETERGPGEFPKFDHVSMWVAQLH